MAILTSADDNRNRCSLNASSIRVALHPHPGFNRTSMKITNFNHPKQ